MRKMNIWKLMIKCTYEPMKLQKTNEQIKIWKDEHMTIEIWRWKTKIRRKKTQKTRKLLWWSWWCANGYPLVIWHSYWAWPFIVDLPIENGDFPYVFKRLPEGKPPFSYGFPMVFPLKPLVFCFSRGVARTIIQISHPWRAVGARCSCRVSGYRQEGGRRTFAQIWPTWTDLCINIYIYT
jgi:hypothetical protein